MTQKTTAGERLAQIETRYFNDIAWDEVRKLNHVEFVEFLLSNVERLLKETTDGHTSQSQSLVAEYFADDTLIEQANLPLESHSDGPIKLTPDQYRQLVIKFIACTCRQMNDHTLSDGRGGIAFEGPFRASHKAFANWLCKMPYEHVAMHVAYIMKKTENRRYSDMFYQPAQDATADIFSAENCQLIGEPEKSKMSPRDYVECILDELLRIERHWERGRRLKLDPEVVILHDCIFGCVPRCFDKKVLEAAKVLHDYMDKEVRGRLRTKEKYVLISEIPESLRRKFNDLMAKVRQKVREVRDQYLGKGWLGDFSLASGYVLAQAEHISGFMTVEED